MARVAAGALWTVAARACTVKGDPTAVGLATPSLKTSDLLLDVVTIAGLEEAGRGGLVATDVDLHLIDAHVEWLYFPWC